MDRDQIIRGAKIELARREFFFYCNLKSPEFYKEDRIYLINLCEELQRLSAFYDKELTDCKLLMEKMDEFAEKYPQYAHIMPIRESIYKMNRLEGLQYSIRMQQIEIGAVNNEQIRAHLERNALRE